jgi:thiamine biosynthesis lipoprotein
MSAAVLRTEVAMGTFVSIEVVGRGSEPEASAAVDRAFGWFNYIESLCTRFDPASELMRLTSRIGESVPVSAALFEAVRFALAVAEASGGAFDPTVGATMEARGFTREHRTGRLVRTEIDPAAKTSYRDVIVDPGEQSIRLLCPLVLDLGAVAKGLAVDMAAAELRPFANFAIDAGGDLFFGGFNPRGEPWSVGIRHPRKLDEIVDVLRVSNMAVCTSGDYERKSPVEHAGHHIVNPVSGAPVASAASATVVAPTAMAADAIATAAFVLGPSCGTAFMESQGVEGLLLTPELERTATAGFHTLLRDHSPHHAEAATT